MPVDRHSLCSTLPVHVRKRQDEAAGVISLELASDTSEALPAFEPGSHIDVHITDGLVRQYSLCGDPHDLDKYTVGVLLEPQSRGGSKAIHESFVVGKHLRISRPKNNFRLAEDATHSILVAGGIGITPILSMARYLLASGASFELHYCTRSIERTAFRSIVRSAPFMGSVTLHLSDGDPQHRFVAEQALASPSAGTHLYVCGPSGFMDHILRVAAGRGWPPNLMHREYFGVETDKTGGMFYVRAARTGITVEIPGDKSIAEVLIACGVAVPLSCEAGLCGTCLTSVLEGVPEHRDVFQTDDEKSNNRSMTICCSRAKSSMLVLDI
jgi:vanillate monooxygenase ferredoxin subunit